MSPTNKLIVLTGGGTAGHVMPHIAMLEDYKLHGFRVAYLGSKGIEKSLLEDFQVPYYTIQVGKLRRYFSWQNFTDIFRLFIGFFQSLLLLAKLRPAIVMSKGGFVSVPVAYAAKVLGIPLVSHESDFTPGLANRLIAPIAQRVLYSFPETAQYLGRNSELVGIPVRRELLSGQPKKGREICGFSDDGRKTILIMGGSLGAQRINECVEQIISDLVNRYQVIHITGKGKSSDIDLPYYKSFEFVSAELAHLIALSDLVISRAGANSLFELLALHKPMLLIPLEQGSRGDQVLNAACFEKLGLATVIREESLSPSHLFKSIEFLLNTDHKSSQDAKTNPGVPGAYLSDPREKIMHVIDQILRENSN